MSQKAITFGEACKTSGGLVVPISEGRDRMCTGYEAHKLCALVGRTYDSALDRCVGQAPPPPPPPAPTPVPLAQTFSRACFDASGGSLARLADHPERGSRECRDVSAKAVCGLANLSFDLGRGACARDK